MVIEVYKFVENCIHWHTWVPISNSKNGWSYLHQLTHYDLWPSTYLGHQQDTRKAVRVITTSWYCKGMRAILIVKITATLVAHIFFHDWVRQYGILDGLFSQTGQQFVSKCFTLLCRYLGVKGSTSTSYHPHTNGEVWKWKNSLVSPLGLYLPRTSKTEIYSRNH